ncbi:MAG: hypothetical protein ICV73_21635 [Acetobacteraceae bacterium]|nr:hypothetical protein [Acetobacteraceae bacterium]
MAVAAVGVPVLAAGLLQALRAHDSRRAEDAWRALEGAAEAAPDGFDPAMVADLPAPARRYFLHAIAPGTPLRSVVEIEMTGQLSLGTKEAPDYMPMRARQILAGTRGFVWLLDAGAGPMRISGSDGYLPPEAWTRFWLLKFAPVAQAGGGDDFARSAAGRAIAESVFWAPAALLPGPGVAWEPLDEHTARARVSHGGEAHMLDVTVDPEGRPRSVLIQRWSRENPEREWRLQPFGGTAEGTLLVDGYRLAARVEGGNWFGTERYFPFYRVAVTRIGFPEPRPRRAGSA